MAPARLVSLLRRSLTVRVVVAMSMAVAGSWLFLEIADDVLEGETTSIDRGISLQLYDFHDPALDGFMRAITFLGSAWILTGLVVVAAGWALWRKRVALAGLLVAVGVAAQALNWLLKSFFQRPRPDLLEITYPPSYSFPSGHAMNSTAIYGILVLVAVRLTPRLRWPLYILTPVLILLIGTSRVYLGVHWSTDVLAGIAAGTVLPIAASLAMPRESESRPNSNGD